MSLFQIDAKIKECFLTFAFFSIILSQVSLAALTTSATFRMYRPDNALASQQTVSCIMSGRDATCNYPFEECTQLGWYTSNVTFSHGGTNDNGTPLDPATQTENYPTSGSVNMYACTVNFTGSLVFSATTSYFNVFWNVSYSMNNSRDIAVKCALNCPIAPTNLNELENCVNSGQGQKCEPYPFTHRPPRGSCAVPNPQYRLTQQNEIKCVAYYPLNTALQGVSE